MPDKKTPATQAGVDLQSATRTLGSTQDDVFQGHWHRSGKDNLGNWPGSYDVGKRRGAGEGANYWTDAVVDPVSDGKNGPPRTSSETRPINVAVNFIIKY